MGIFLFNNFWIIFIFFTCVNAFALKVRSKKNITNNQSLKKGYSSLIKGILFYGNIPWVIMGIGNLSYGTKSGIDYLNPNSNNYFVLVFYFSILLIWTLGTNWIYFKNGAAFLEKHPGLFRGDRFKSKNNITVKQIKIFWGILTLVLCVRVIIYLLNYSFQ